MKKKISGLLSVGSVLSCILLNTNIVEAQADSTKNAPIPSTSAASPTPAASGNASHDTVAMGVAVSPGVLRFTCKPGNIESHEVKITNNTNMTYNMKVGFTDYMQNNVGKPMFSPADARKSRYALSRWATASPTFFTLSPGKAQKITVTVNVPNNDSANIAAWTVMEIDQIRKKQAPASAGGDKTLAMGISPEMGFGVYLYQNPPNVKVNNVEITHFSYRDTAYMSGGKMKNTKQLWLHISNVGDGISYCVSYAQLTNLKTGKTYDLNKQSFTILPGFDRDFYFEMPKNLAPGDYSGVGVVYFGDKAPKKVAQLNFNYK
jgi:hypothetical protein